MANDVSNIILRKVIEMRDHELIYEFCGNLYRKDDNTNYDDFIKKIMKINMNKCVKMILNETNKIGCYIGYRGVEQGNISVEEYENKIDISSFNLTVDEYKRLKATFIKSGWTVCRTNCGHSRKCLCNSKTVFNCKKDGNCYDENEPVTWENTCNMCHEVIYDNHDLTSHWENFSQCFCECDEHLCTICDYPSTIIARPLNEYDSDHCGLFKDDVYNIFITSNIDIFKDKCLDIIKTHIKSKKVMVI